MGEGLERLGRPADAIPWARAELQKVGNINVPLKARAGRLLGRAHSALGEHALSAAALDAALLEATTGELLLTEAVTVRERAQLGMAAAEAGGSGMDNSAHWDREVGQARLQEVAARMAEGSTCGRCVLTVEARLRGLEQVDGGVAPAAPEAAKQRTSQQVVAPAEQDTIGAAVAWFRAVTRLEKT